MQARRSVSMALAAFVMAVLPAAAHHGWSGNSQEEFELTGTVEQPVSLAGPHATARLQVEDDLWNLVFAPPTRTAAAGLTEDAVPVGATVTASGHRHLDEGTLEVKTERLTWNDTVFDVYPERD